MSLMVFGVVSVVSLTKKPLIYRLTGQSYSSYRADALDDLESLDAESKKKYVSQLTNRLRHRDNYVRKNAAYALGTLGPLAYASIPVLKEALNDSEVNVRESAASALAKLGENTEETVSDLIRVIESSAGIGAMRELQNIARVQGNRVKNQTPAIAYALSQALQNPDWLVRSYAVQAITFFASLDFDGMERTAPLLIKALNDDNANVRRNAGLALEKIGTQEALQALTLYRQAQKK